MTPSSIACLLRLLFLCYPIFYALECATAAIVFEDIEDIFVTRITGNSVALIDVDNDSKFDFRFTNTGGLFSVEPQNGSRIVVDAGAEDAFVRKLESGSLVYASLLGESTLTTQTSIFAGSVVVGDGETVTFGDFLGQGFFGFELSWENGIRYGWFEVESLGSVGGHLRSFAYESQSDRSILVGAIPEPSTTLLLLGVSFLSLSRRRRLGICYSTW